MRRQKRISCYLPSVCRSGDRVNPQKVVPAGGGNLERAFGAFLALDVAQVELCRLLRVHL